MRQIAEEKLLPADIDAEPPVQTAAALRSVIRGYRDEIEREQRLPKALVEQFHAAGFYSLVMPRALGGDRKSTRLNSSHVAISYAVFCLKKKTKNISRR